MRLHKREKLGVPVLPLPSCPLSLDPAANIWPVLVRNKEKVWPTETWTILVSASFAHGPVTFVHFSTSCCGGYPFSLHPDRISVCSGHTSPIWPKTLFPHPQTLPSLAINSIWLRAAAPPIHLTPRSSPTDLVDSLIGLSSVAIPPVCGERAGVGSRPKI